MKFYQRLAYYLCGFLIGMVALFMIMKGRNQDFNYMPNARVLSNLRNKPLSYSDQAKQQIANKVIDTAMIRQTMHYGDVDFSKSNIPFKGGKLYTIEGKNAQGQKIMLEFINKEEAAELYSIKK